MSFSAKSIRSFIGAKNFEQSQAFYRDLGFQEMILSKKLSYFQVNDNLGFYLQDYYIKDWINNSMLFLEIDNPYLLLKEIQTKKLTQKYPDVRLSEIKEEDWGYEFFLHDPSGILWHCGSFK